MVNLKATVRVRTKNGLYPVYIRFTMKSNKGGKQKSTPDKECRMCLLSCYCLTLFAGDVFNALLMTTSSKLCVEEFVETLAAYVFADETTGEDDDVGVVVLSNEVSNLWLPNKTGTDALMLVEGHGDAFARTAHSDAWIYFAFLDAFSQCVAIGGIVTGFFGIGAVVLVLIAFLFEIFLDELL